MFSMLPSGWQDEALKKFLNEKRIAREERARRRREEEESQVSVHPTEGRLLRPSLFTDDDIQTSQANMNTETQQMAQCIAKQLREEKRATGSNTSFVDESDRGDCPELVHTSSENESESINSFEWDSARSVGESDRAYCPELVHTSSEDERESSVRSELVDTSSESDSFEWDSARSANESDRDSCSEEEMVNVSSEDENYRYVFPEELVEAILEDKTELVCESVVYCDHESQPSSSIDSLTITTPIATDNDSSNTMTHAEQDASGTQLEVTEASSEDVPCEGLRAEENVTRTHKKKNNNSCTSHKDSLSDCSEQLQSPANGREATHARQCQEEQQAGLGGACESVGTSPPQDQETIVFRQRSHDRHTPWCLPLARERVWSQLIANDSEQG